MSKAKLDKDEIKKLSTVKHPTMLVVRDASGESLNACIAFVRAGDSTNFAEELAQGDLRSARTETHLIAMPDSFDAEDYGLYWDQIYSG